VLAVGVGDDELSLGDDEDASSSEAAEGPRDGARVGGLREITWLVLDLSCQWRVSVTASRLRTSRYLLGPQVPKRFVFVFVIVIFVFYS